MDIDVSKENIQPLRGGRNLTQLGAALQAQSDGDVQRQLQQQKEEFEAAIRDYQGTDPLEPWFCYIQWVEQSFPKHGHEGHLDKLIKDCLQTFERDERYYQDRRFIKLWIKYIDCLANPLEIYQRLYNSGIGVECSEFYRAWAYYCEDSEDFKKANQVYMLGLQAQAQPLDELEEAHMNFQLYFAQRMLHDDSPTKRKAASALAETRLALTSLKSFKRRNVATAPINRTGDNVKSIVPGVMRQQTGSQNNRHGSNIMLNVYEDAPSTSNAPIAVIENPGPASLVQAYSIENEKEVGIWTSAKIQMVHANVVPHQPLPFTPYEDEEDVLRLPATHKSRCEEDLVFTVPLCVPDPPDPTKIPCYNKAEVYVDEKEYSLEEIRSRKFNLKTNLKTGTENVKQEQTSFNHSLAQCSALETLANCALDTEQDHLAQLMPLNIPTHITKVTNMHSPGEPKVLVNLDSKELSQLAGKKNDENQKPLDENQMGKPSTSTAYSEGASNNYVRNNLVEEFNRSLLNNLHGDVTMNTKEARWELRNIFNDNEPTMVQPIMQPFEVPKFDIHEDRSMTMALNTQHKQMLHDEVQASPQDKENANKIPAAIAPTNVNKTLYYEEPSCTQVFNFNIKDASTPNMSQFKKPTSIDHSSKLSVPKFSIDESVIEHEVKKEEFSRPEARMDQQTTVDNQGGGLSVIMEATREYNSKSGSSSSGQSTTRGNFTGYTTTPYSEKTHASNYDSMYNQQDPMASKRNSTASQPRLANGRFAPAYPQPRDDKVQQPVPYFSHDHQYQKPMPQNYNFQGQRMHPQYQQNYQYPQGYNNQQAPVQQGYPSPSPAYHSPQHPGMQSPHMSPVVQPGFQSPPYTGQQMGYHSPGHNIMSPQHVYQHYPNQVEQQHVYAPQQSPGFQSPPHQSQYQQNVHYYQRPSQVNLPQNHAYNQQGYHAMPNQYGNQMYQHHPNVSQNQHPNMSQNQHPNMSQNQHPNMSQNQHPNMSQNQHPNMSQSQSPHHPNMSQTQHHHNISHNQSPHQPNASQNQSQHHPSANQNQSQHHPNASQNSYMNQSQIPYGQQPRQSNEKNAYNAAQEHQPFQIYQSPQSNQNSYRDNSYVNQETYDKTAHQPMQTSPDMHVVKQDGHPSAQKQNKNKQTPPAKPAAQKSPTAALRSVRHDMPNMKPQTPDVGFSNQFLNFISNRNEPKDNANTPKFSNSPNISQKMHKNLYVSSPEQAQIPPSSGLSDSDSKDGLTAQTITPIQSAKIAHVEKNKDISKRQLDFEQRAEIQSEDSRDSMSKESRISSVYSRHSDFQSDGYGMDVDSENSMECNAFKSSHSISLIETSEIPKPADIDFPKVIDPFSKKIIESLLEYVKFPNKTHAEGYIEVRSVPKLQLATMISIGNSRYAVEKQLGKGNYGAVFLCSEIHSNRAVAVKYQKPSRPWEFYICQEIKARIKDPFMLPGYMDITTAYLADNASLFVSEYSKYGSLLDVANKIKVATTKCINEYIVFLLTSEMLSIVHYLHKAQIIHADIKPDNFLLMKIPTEEWRTPSLQLIDLGCSIDMSLFPEGTTFRELISTEGFTCTEMREGKPWTYQTDLYCLAGTIHVILMGSYMKVANRLGQWNIDKKLPRYMKISTWDKIFTSLLNVPDCNNLPDLMDLKNDIETLLREDTSQTLTSQLRNFANVLKSR